MRILYFSQDYSPHDFRFLNSLAETEHEIFFLRLENTSRALEKRSVPYKVNQVPWVGGDKPVSWKDYISLANGLRKVVRQIKPDLIHAGPIQRVAFLPALIGFHPLVSMSWGSDLLKETDRNAWMRWNTRFTLAHSDWLVGDCLVVKDKAISLGFDPQRISLFPWGIDLQQFFPQKEQGLKERLGWEHEFVILSLRSWEPVYGVDVVVKAFIKAIQREAHLRLLLLGNGSLAPEIHQLVSANYLEDKVSFGGQIGQDNLPTYYHNSDLYVSASHSDGSSVSLMEALGCGLPVLVSDIPGNREWIELGKTGYLFTDGAADDLAQKMVEVYQQRAGITGMKKNARALAMERADWKKNFQVLLDTYEEVLRGTKSKKI
ncbi:MAG TPA: glycosyltransferase family 4 protein [Longilinea sp.]|nr:glycosyltransferase family 4 protein [Longilinea sp.]